MAKKKSKVCQQAEDWFIENYDATGEEVAVLYGIEPKTVSRWRRLYNWDDKRQNYHASPVKIKQLLQQELLSVAQGNEPQLKADAISKLNAALDRLDKKIDPFVVKKVLEDLDSFTAEIDPLLASKMLPLHLRFLQHRIKIDG
ncbi:hypothetical protein [Roseivirga sp. UBA838]|uniref:hypothetical protein n=1 Tax=Roseivirga sp. UBA838 TaxID=1947393 RepID=UPI00257B3FD5|nr:hypothetical protein [Roseivirga sp. UBA838]|tara:strand:- start:16874 stop:17302 length:429 start_codon:yes stop_codon:yes gene_type:complete